MKPKRTATGFYIYCKVRVPKERVAVVGRARLIKSGTVPFSECKDADEAKGIQLRWRRELKEQFAGSLTFRNYVELYRQNSGEHAQSSIVSRLDFELGAIPMAHKDRLESKFEDMVSIISKEKVKRWKLVDGVKKLCDTEKPISKETLKAYKRYFCAICNRATTAFTPKAMRIHEIDNPASAIVIGKPGKRRRRIEEAERTAYRKECQKLYLWFLPVVDFARTMPIRPSDQVALFTDCLDMINWQIPYLPAKTSSTEVIAYPRILPHMRDYAMSRIVDAECRSFFFRPGFSRNKEDVDKRYPISYWTLDNVHNNICEEAGIKNLQFYDWRHDAVNYLQSIGFSKSQIMAFAGWSSDEMVDWYDTGDPVRLANACAAVEIEAAKKLKSIVVGHTGWAQA